MDLKPSEEILLRAYQSFLQSGREMRKDDIPMVKQAHTLMEKLNITGYELNFKDCE